jgi:Tol biopolymer transport system component
MKQWFGIWSVAGILALASSAQAVTIERVSLSSAGEQANGHSGWAPAISDDGRFVAFCSFATNLVPGDTNGKQDVFVRDRKTGKTERVSISSAGGEGNGPSFYHPRISADGRYVAFHSDASNLVPGDTNGKGDLFVRDRRTGTTERASLDPAGKQFPGGALFTDMTPDGRFISFGANRGIYLRDRRRGVTEQPVSAPGAAYDSAGDGRLSRDGRFVAFQQAHHIPPRYTSVTLTIWVLDRRTGKQERGSEDTAEPGTFIGVYVQGTSADGRFVAFTRARGHPLLGDLYLWDREKGKTEMISIGLDGRGTTRHYPVLGGISADGRFVVFGSWSSNLVPGDTNGTCDVFVRDRLLGKTTRVSVSATGEQADGFCGWEGMTPDARFVGFSSDATNLVPGDTNGKRDIFLVDPGPAAK